MKKMKILGPLFVLISLSNPALAENYFLNYQSGRTDFDLTLNYFKSSSNFGTDGSKTDLPSGNYFQTIDTSFQGRYVIASDFALFGGFNVSNAESSDVVATRRNSTFNKINFGTDLQIYNSSSFNLTAEISYLQSLEKIQTDTDSVLNSDGANEVTAQIGSTLKLDSLFPFFKGGIKYRTEGLSTLLLYTAGLEIRASDVAFGGLLSGYTSIKDDEKTNQSTVRDAITNRVDGFSKKYYSVNPSLLDSEVYLKYNFSKDFSVKGFGGYTILGTNAALGIHAGATFAWGFGSSHEPKSYRPKDLEPRKVQAPMKKPTQKPIVTDPAKGGFKEDTEDGVNQDYFKPVSPSKDEYIEQIEGSPRSLKNATEPEPPETPAASSVDSNPEYKIKLRKIKKKKPPQH